MRRTRQSSGEQRCGVFAGLVCPAKRGQTPCGVWRMNGLNRLFVKRKQGVKKAGVRGGCGKVLPSRGKCAGRICRIVYGIVFLLVYVKMSE